MHEKAMQIWINHRRAHPFHLAWFNRIIGIVLCTSKFDDVRRFRIILLVWTLIFTEIVFFLENKNRDEIFKYFIEVLLWTRLINEKCNIVFKTAIIVFINKHKLLLKNNFPSILYLISSTLSIMLKFTWSHSHAPLLIQLIKILLQLNLNYVFHLFP